MKIDKVNYKIFLWRIFFKVMAYESRKLFYNSIWFYLNTKNDLKT